MFSDGEVIFPPAHYHALFVGLVLCFEMEAQMYKSFCTYVVYVYSIKCCCDPIAHVLI